MGPEMDFEGKLDSGSHLGTPFPTSDLASFRLADPLNTVAYNADWEVLKESSNYGLFGGDGIDINGLISGTNIMMGSNSGTILGAAGFENVFGDFIDSNFSNMTYAPEDELFYRHSAAMTAVYCVAYITVFIVGLIGNCFVIAVVLRAPRMRTVTNYFIVNLAVADILVIIFCLPATLMSNIFVRKYP